jgi:uncharacterized protein YjbJ (UPF0337 family)
MNKDFIAGKWNEIKGELRKTWGNITDDEFEKTKGDAQAIAGIVQQRYGLAKEDLRKILFVKDATKLNVKEITN